MTEARNKVVSLHTDPACDETHAPDFIPLTERVEEQSTLNANDIILRESTSDNHSAFETHGEDNVHSPLVVGCSKKVSILSEGNNTVDDATGNRSPTTRPYSQNSTGRPSSTPVDISGNRILENGAYPQIENLCNPNALLEVTPAMNWLACGCYFCYMFGTAAINAYFGYIFSEKGISKIIIGVLISVIPLSSVFILPIFSFIADKYRCAILILILSVISSTVLVWFYTTASNYAMLISTFLGLVILQTPINPLMDRNTLAMFPPRYKTTKWAFVRSFGAVGWGVGNVVASAAAYGYGSWSIGVIQYTAGHLGMLLCLWRLKARKVAPNPMRVEPAVRFRDVLAILARNPRLMVLLLASSMMGMAYAIVNTFLFIFLKEIGGSEVLFGLTVLLTVSTEIPLFLFYNRVEDWCGARAMLSIAMGLWALRAVGYSLLWNPWLVLLIEPLHGVSFGLMWLPGVRAVSTAFPARLSASATAVLFFFVYGVGGGLGGLAGLLNTAVGSRQMFRIASLAMVGILALYQLTDCLLSYFGWRLYPAEEPGGACERVAEDSQEERASGSSRDTKLVPETVDVKGVTGTPRVN